MQKESVRERERNSSNEEIHQESEIHGVGGGATERETKLLSKPCRSCGTFMFPLLNRREAEIDESVEGWGAIPWTLHTLPRRHRRRRLADNALYSTHPAVYSSCLRHYSHLFFKSFSFLRFIPRSCRTVGEGRRRGNAPKGPSGRLREHARWHYPGSSLGEKSAERHTRGVAALERRKGTCDH